jgi:putative OPT family oligopeptide transporter
VQKTDTTPPFDEFPAVDTTLPQFTLRAVLTGMLLGAVLSLCNIYAGLKIGWGFNMSITAALLSFAFWHLLHATVRTRRWNILENNVNQTAASAGASISSAGLVAPIPAWTMITGEQLGWLPLTIWVFSVSLVGIAVAVALRRQMLLVDRLPFPNGIATGETLLQMYARGREALARVSALVGAGLLAAATKVAVTVFKIPKLPLPGSVSGVTLNNVGFALDPSFLMVGVGALIGMRACASLLFGAALAWGVLAPVVVNNGWVERGAPEVFWFNGLINWMVWPGVTMMVTASLTSFAFSWRSVLAALRGRGGAAEADPHEVPRKLYLGALMGVIALSAGCQVALFDIAPWVAVASVLLTFLLAVVAARVSGETGITPVGPMGKITQLAFAALAPGNVTANLMTANVTGGAASQCADLLHDMKTGLMIGASPKFLAAAQFFGVLAGSLAGSAAYLILVPDPASMLLTEEWAAPAVAQWKAVAEVLTEGLDQMPAGAVAAAVWAGGLGIALAIAEKVLPSRAARWVPSPASVGLAIVVPAYYSVSMFIGGVLAWVAFRVARTWAQRFVVVLAAGAIAGESLTGIGLAIQKILAG